MTGQWAAVFVYDREHQACALQALYGHQDALVMPWPPETARADAEKLAQIAALVREHLNPTTYFSLEVQRILDAPSVGGTGLAAQPHPSGPRDGALDGVVGGQATPAARAGGIDRDALLDLFSDDPRIGNPEAMVERVAALVQPVLPALDLAAVRRILTAALPADPKWAVWVEGRIEEIAKATLRVGTNLSDAETRMAIQALRFEADCYLGRVYPVQLNDHSRLAAQQRSALAARLEAAS